MGNLMSKCVNSESDINETDIYGETKLIRAADRGDTEECVSENDIN